MSPQELWERSAAAWINFVDKGDLNRSAVLDEPMLRLAGDIAGLDICDIGCGEGRFARMLSRNGATVVGVEPVARLIEEAHRKDPDSRFVKGSGERLPFASEAFDLVICYLVLIDIPDFRAAIHEMARTTKPGGRLLVANLNSFCTTRQNPWIRDGAGGIAQVVVDQYFGERPEVVSWSGIEVVNFHRPFEAYMKAFLSEGLVLTDFEEPRPSEKAVEEHPRIADALRIPIFHVMQWRKD